MGVLTHRSPLGPQSTLVEICRRKCLGGRGKKNISDQFSRHFLRKGIQKRSELPSQSPIWLNKVVKTGFHGLKQHGEWEEKELSKPFYLRTLFSLHNLSQPNMVNNTKLKPF